MEVNYVSREAVDTAADLTSNTQTYEALSQGYDVAETTSASGPGFGIVAALAALGGAAALAYYRNRNQEETTEKNLEELDDEYLEE